MKRRTILFNNWVIVLLVSLTWGLSQCGFVRGPGDDDFADEPVPQKPVDPSLPVDPSPPVVSPTPTPTPIVPSPTPTPTPTPIVPSPSPTPIPTQPPGSDRPVLQYNGSRFLEDLTTNNGRIGNVIAVDVSNGVFYTGFGTMTAGVHYRLTGTAVPAGLSFKAQVITSTEVELRMDGQATAHDVTDSKSGIMLEFLGPAFANGLAPNDGSQLREVAVVFYGNVTMSYNADVFVEHQSDTGAIDNIITATLLGNSFATGLSNLGQGTHYTLSGATLPAGLTMQAKITGSNQLTLTLAGNANLHDATHSVSGVQITFNNNIFANGVGPSDGTRSLIFDVTFIGYSSVPISKITFYRTPSYNGNLGGRSGADTKCLANQPTAVNQTHVRALLTVSAADSIAAMPANYGIPYDQPIVGPTGVTIADHWADLLDGSIAQTLEQAGIVVGASNFWWSGSDPYGLWIDASKTCQGWASNNLAYGGITGHKKFTGPIWIQYSSTPIVNCAQTAYLVCAAFNT